MWGSSIGVCVGVGVGVGVGGGGGGGRRRSIVVNATIFLPISEGTFVDANDPLLTRY
jgi:hypothetical protein